MRVLQIIFGGLLLLIGLILTAGGANLLWLGGSAYYVLTGLGLAASGLAIALGRLVGVLLYAAVFALTVIWAFWEAGNNVWALVPRLVAPTVLMIAVLLLSPTFKQDRVRWRGVLGGSFSLILAAVVVPFFYGSSEVAGARDRPAPSQFTDSGSDADWSAYGGTYAAQRYSKLDQIDRTNVALLEKVWTYKTGDLPGGGHKDSRYAAETTPLKIGDTVYLCSAKNILIALDAANGSERWRYDPGVKDAFIPYSASCRGVVYFDAEAMRRNASGNETPNSEMPSRNDETGEGCAQRIIEGTLDARLIAVSARTGEPCSGFGKGGSVNITVGMGVVEPGMVAMTSPPTIVRGVIVTGHQVKDGVSIDAPSGVLQGFDAITGERLWAWDMVQPDNPSPDEFTRGTPNMWTTASGDEELGLVYMPMGNSAGDYVSYDRTPEENTFSTSLIALDVMTGKPRWHFQTARVDVWDYDLGSQATLFDYQTANGPVPALILPSKQGDLYVLDRRTGEPLTGVEERPVAQGGVEPDLRTKTQPFSTWNTLAKPALEERDMWGMSPIDQMICRIGFRKASYEGIYTPPTADRHWIQYPGYNGGSDWGGVSISPDAGLLIANYNDMPNHNRLVARAEADRKLAGSAGGGHADLAPQKGATYAIDVNAGWRLKFTGLLCKEPPYGGLRAIDLATGKTVWDRPYGTARNNGPFGIKSRLPFTIGTPNNGGSVVTKGGLIFIAAATDDRINAVDIETGKTLWTDILPAGGQATPMTYEYEDRQYVLIMAGGHHFMETRIGDKLVAYALPEKGSPGGAVPPIGAR